MNKINNFDEADRNEALVYLKQCIDSERIPARNKNEVKKKENTSRTKQQTSVSLRKMTGLQTNSVSKRLRSDRILKKRKIINNDVMVKGTVLKCKICDSTKRSVLNFLEHLNSHVGTPISCVKCRQSFNGRVSFDFHVGNTCGRNVASNKIYKCEECSKVNN